MNKLAKFAEAVEDYVKGDRGKAALKMSQALGSSKMLPPVYYNIDRLIKPPDVLADSLLKMMKEESKKRG